MKVIYLHQYFNTPSMSGGVRSYDVSKRLIKSGHTVYMITSDREGIGEKKWRYSNEEGINTYWLSLHYSNKLNYLKRMKAFLLFAFYSSRKGSQLQADVIFATSTPLTIAIPALYLSWKSSIPLVFEVRDLWPEVPIALGVIKNPIVKYLARSLEKYTYKRSKAIIALSDGMKHGVIKTGCNKDKITVIPNFSNRELFDKSKKNKGFHFFKREWLENSPLLVYTGTFGIVNGVDYLIDIAKELLLLGSDVKILLVGGGKQYADIIQYAQKKGVLNKNLFIEKSVSKIELPKILEAANLASNIVIDVPEVWHNSANKFFDALASGTPVLINGGGWQADLINRYDAGVVTYGLTMQQSALKIDQFLHNKEALQKSSENAKILSERYFDKENLTRKVEEVLLSCIKRE